jgi:tRNA A-37 threonylcarbamoyl transferase component Bud32
MTFNEEKTEPVLTDNKEIVCPKTIGPYQIESLFAKGGMSLIYLAKTEKQDKPLLIKVLSPNLTKNPEIVDRFLKEAHIIAITNHPNIVKLYGEGKWDGGIYIAMELIRGISLRQFIAQRALSTKKALEIALQVAYALCHLHANDVVHRDLKPENILINEEGVAKIIDFGISQLREDNKKEEKAKIIGTPSYMSPEQKANPNNASFTSDIFSLGVITYELLLGRFNPANMDFAILSTPLKDILQKALQADPKERYQDIVDFITDVSAYLKSNVEDSPAEMVNLEYEFFLPQDPKWPQVMMSMYFNNEKLSFSSVYADFFKLPDQYLVIVVEGKKPSSSLIFLSFLKGLIKMGVEEHRKDFSATAFLNWLNEALMNDSLKNEFVCSLLCLYPEKNQLSFISCGNTSIWHIAGNLKELTASNPLLGTTNIAFDVTSDLWNMNDVLLLTSPMSNVRSDEVALSLKVPLEERAKVLAEKSGLAIVLQRLF